MNTGERIRQCRKSTGLTQAQLAEKAGMSLMSIRRYESGERTPNMGQLLDIAKALDISFLELVDPEEITNCSRDIDIMLPEDIEFIQQLTGATLKDGKLIYPDGTRNFPYPKNKRGIYIKESSPFKSDKAVRVICNMDTELHNLVSKSAEQNHRTFEDELEDILYWSFEDRESYSADEQNQIEAYRKKED